MQVLCERSNTGSDVRCTICGQGFLVYWQRTSPSERALARQKVILTLKEHHENEMSGHHAHPSERFSIPSWDTDVRFAAIAAHEEHHLQRA